MSVNMVTTSNVSSEKGWSVGDRDLKNNHGAISWGGGGWVSDMN